MKNKLKFNRLRSFGLLLLLGLALSFGVNAQDIKPEDCGKSKENISQCFDKLINQMKAMKTNANDKVKALKVKFGNGVGQKKASNGIDTLKSLYDAAKKSIEETTKRMKKKDNPDFNDIKAYLDSSVNNYTKFMNEANRAITGADGGAIDIFDIVKIFVNIGCSLANIPDELCKFITESLDKLEVSLLKWNKWDSIKP